MSKEITVDTVIDKKIFFKFALFDSFIRKRRWLLLAKFSGIFFLSACICFFKRESAEQAVMLGCVLLSVGFGLPLFYFLYFINSVRMQIKKCGLSKPKWVYSLTLSDKPEGIVVKNPGGEEARYEWGSLHGAYWVKGCTYLYVLNNKAFLLPDEQISEGAKALFLFLTTVLPKEKLYNKKKNNLL